MQDQESESFASQLEQMQEQESIVTELRKILDNNKINHKDKIKQCKNLHEVNVYCKINHLSGQQLGPLTETYLIHKCQMKKNKASACIGDCKDRFQEDNEIKASGGGKDHNKFNYVQLRPCHDIDYYIFTAHYLCEENLENLGELFIFKINKNDINPLICKYGGYAHGTNSKQGKITLEELNDKNNTKEYCLRPVYGSPLWNELVKFRVYESDL